MSYKKGTQIKIRLIECTYAALLSRQTSDLKIRDLAEQAGCAPSSVYQHFSGLDELIATASIKFLDEYTAAYSEMMDRTDDVVESYLQGWEIFCKFAFERPDIYTYLFWDLKHFDFEEAMVKYYSLFPVTPPTSSFSIQYYLTCYSGDVVERDFVLMRMMASQHLVSIEDAHYVSVAVTSIARNLLMDCIKADAQERKEAAGRCMELVSFTLHMALDNYKYRHGSHKNE